MKIQEQDMYHGSALTQIVEHKSFKALNRGSDKYGHYLVNADKHVFAKYRKNGKSPWIFTIQPDELAAIQGAAKRDDVFLCLVCGKVTVCSLDRAEIALVVDFAAKAQQWIRVDVPKNGSCHVSGSAGKLGPAIPHKSFPDKIFS